MEEEMKKKFYEQLDAKIETKKSNNSFLNGEKYDLLIQEICQLKRGDRKKEPRDYQLLKRYDVVYIGNTGTLIYPDTEGNSSVKFYVRKEDLFDVIHDAHLAVGHGGRNRIIKETQTKYKNITAESIMLYLSLCVPCLKKSKIHKKELMMMKPMTFGEMNSRAQIDLIDMQSRPDGDLKWILVYQDHLTKFVQLRPISSKHPPEIAYQLLDIFSIFGAPNILQSETLQREFVNSIIIEFGTMWDTLKIVHGKTIESQGSVERDNITDTLTKWLQSNSTSHWGNGLRFVQVMRNKTYQEDIKCSPYEAMFGQPMKIGLKTSSLPDDAIDDISTEEELEKIISGQVRRDDVSDNNKGSLLKEETSTEDVSPMVIERPCSPSIYVQRKHKINEKRKNVKSYLETQAFKMIRLAREKYSQ